MINRMVWYCSRTTVFITFQMILLFLAVHREQVFTSTLYALQKYEAHRQQIQQRLLTVQQRLHHIKSHTTLQSSARAMKLVPLPLSSVRSLYETDRS